ncbi:MAG: NUDIX domain-containing protein [Candidatus Aenigmarchaeota archaeon]|nr:NUDIX domain-containing protein [Candidatus Aenigmarchaeota archaeon]
MKDRPKVGIGVYIIRDGKVLLLKRKGAHGEGSWCAPGGHLEFGESWEDCAKREVTEEAGIEITNVRFFAVTNDIFEEENKHYITIALLADYVSGEARRMEPEKCMDIGWFSWSELPKSLFLPVRNLMEQGLDPTQQ